MRQCYGPFSAWRPLRCLVHGARDRKDAWIFGDVLLAFAVLDVDISS